MSCAFTYRYIVVEGPIGAGKTSLARRLARHAASDLLLEAPEDNPFLTRFYADPARHALATQLFFLFQRIDQLRGHAQLDLFERGTVADFLFDKDSLFANLTLTADEFVLYQKIFSTLKPRAPRPDLVIYLQVAPSTLTQRIRQRGRAYESSLTEAAGGAAYLNRVAEAYDRFFYHYDEAPVLIVNSARLNFIDDEAAFDLLTDRIAAMRGRREYLNSGD